MKDTSTKWFTIGLISGVIPAVAIFLYLFWLIAKNEGWL